MYSRPSTSQIRDPSPRVTTNGSPPTPRNARTGELTPPGKSALARSMISCDRVFNVSPPEATDRLQYAQRSRGAHGRSRRRNHAGKRSREIDVFHNVLESNVDERSWHD